MLWKFIEEIFFSYLGGFVTAIYLFAISALISLVVWLAKWIKKKLTGTK